MMLLVPTASNGSLEAEPAAQAAWRLAASRLDRLLLRIDPKHRRGPPAEAEREATVAAAELEDAQAVHVDELVEGLKLDAVRIELHAARLQNSRR